MVLHIIKNGKRIVSFVPTQDSCIIAPPEEFRDITQIVVPDVKNYYMISNYGRIWHKYQRRFLIPYVDSKGYLFIRLTTYNNGEKNCRVHRLVLMTFDYYDGCEKTLINHKDGNKCNPCIWNLEWSSYSENIKHAWENKIMKRKHSDEEIKKVTEVCELLEENKLSGREIAKKLNVDENFIYSIANGRTFLDITSKYNFPRKKELFSEDQVLRICFFLSTNSINSDDNEYLIDYYKRALEYAGVPIGNNTIDGVRRIKNRKTFKNISCNYNF